MCVSFICESVNIVFSVSFSIDVLLFLGFATRVLFVCLVGLPATATTTYTVLCQFTSSYSRPVVVIGIWIFVVVCPLIDLTDFLCGYLSVFLML
jgi:hypothetical protein